MHEDSWPDNWSGRPILLITRMITHRIGLRLALPLLEMAIVFTRAAPAFDSLFMGCVININTACS